MYILCVCASLCEEKHSAPIESGDYWQTFIIAKDTVAFTSEHRRCRGNAAGHGPVLLLMTLTFVDEARTTGLIITDDGRVSDVQTLAAG